MVRLRHCSFGIQNHHTSALAYFVLKTSADKRAMAGKFFHKTTYLFNHEANLYFVFTPVDLLFERPNNFCEG
ncbi:MAG: hypothetical protein KA138_05380, partial [Saprospiraceae bacterium]|nr:hypothetical protein [Saprospiraceae bacterium]